VPDDPARDAFLASLVDTDLYSIAAFFHDRHPDLVDDVVAQAEAIERDGLVAFAATEGIEPEAAFQTLITGLAVRYYRAVNG
jgi:CRISPR/Cas system-associated protein Csm6